jgi:hypothetical protein
METLTNEEMLEIQGGDWLGGWLAGWCYAIAML